jgi:CheY-like chemotaxis protein
VLPARDGFEAFALAQRGAPDIILVDADMPCLDGAEFCWAYRWRGGTTPVVLLSAVAAGAVRVEVEGGGEIVAADRRRPGRLRPRPAVSARGGCAGGGWGR